MVLNTAERFLILIQHPEKKRFIISEPVKSAGLMGSILLDLTNDAKIELDNGKLTARSSETALSSTHQEILERIAGESKIRKVRTWITRLSRKNGKYQKEILSGLEKKGLIRIEHKRMLGIRYYRTRMINSRIRKQIIDEIRDHIFYGKQIDSKHSVILGLIKACRMYPIICRDKQERKICKKRIREFMKSDEISQGVDRVIREMQAAITGAVVVSTITVAAGSR